MKNFLNKIWDWLGGITEDIYNFFLSLILGKSPISIKKCLAWLFSFAACYVAIFTEKTDILIQLLGIIVLLLGLRSYDKTKYQEPVHRNNVGFKSNTNNEIG